MTGQVMQTHRARHRATRKEIAVKRYFTVEVVGDGRDDSLPIDTGVPVACELAIALEFFFT